MLYDRVREQLAILVPEFGLDSQRPLIVQTFDRVCTESLSIPLGRIAQVFSTINEDGTPFQYSLSLGHASPRLQFLGEVSSPGSSNAERIALSRERIVGLASLFSAEGALVETFSLIDQLAPQDDRELLLDPAGAFWIGASFSASESPSLRVYVNGKWGSETKMWDRLARFTAHFGWKQKWQSVAPLLRAMQPLGMAISLARNGLGGRVYLSAYGNTLGYYEHLAEATMGKECREILLQFAEVFFGDARQFPTRSVVCSFGLDPKREDFKFEVCGHCLFDSDAQVREKCLEWLELIGVEPTIYLRMLETLSEGRLSKKKVGLHSFLGFGLRGKEVHSTIYLKPRMSKSNDDS